MTLGSRLSQLLISRKGQRHSSRCLGDLLIAEQSVEDEVNLWDESVGQLLRRREEGGLTSSIEWTVATCPTNTYITEQFNESFEVYCASTHRLAIEQRPT